MTLLAIMLLFALFAGIAMTVNEGLWNNVVSMFCVVIAGLIAVPWGLELAKFVVDQATPAPENQWAFVFASVWGVFFLAVTLLRVFADKTSRVRVKFIKPIELAGGPLAGLLLAVMFVSFAAGTMWIPLAAGAWEAASPAGWAENAVSYLATPYANALNGFYAGEVQLADLVASK